ncbi:MAG: hypothetical protein HKN40_06890 [Winogradskyella sp.]|nr:hypothetical protein [Winogradskyella sp.]
MIAKKRLIIMLLIAGSCQSLGKLSFVAEISNAIPEVSAIEIHSQSQLNWVIEDSGNSNKLYGLNDEGQILKTITITNARNIDWEDLTFDHLGNLYIGDFGNNSHNRKRFMIYKIKKDDLKKNQVSAELIQFTLPKDLESKNFEAFFITNNSFYIFSKENKNCVVLKVPNQPGKHIAVLKKQFILKGKYNKVTSADISQDGKTVVLLNYYKLWKITDFKDDDFFDGKIKALTFKHHSQKEGICFKTNNEVLITDEQQAFEGGNIYSFNLD